MANYNSDPEYIEVSKSKPIIKNTLPILYDRRLNWSYFDRRYARISLHELKMSLELKYVSLTRQNEREGMLTYKTNFQINSSCAKPGGFQILHQCIVSQMEEFLVFIRGCELINYPLNNISIPTFEETLPILRKLFGSEAIYDYD